MTPTPNVNQNSFHSSEVAASTNQGAEPFVPRREHRDVADEDGPWAQKTVLSFDGGGVRGYSSLLILKAIMIRIKQLETLHQDPVFASTGYPWQGKSWDANRNEETQAENVDDFLPCHYFDYLIGTSTGGLSSIMLGRLRMTVDEGLENYKTFGNNVFGKPRWFHEKSILWYPRARYSCRKTRSELQLVVYKAIQRDRNSARIHEARSEPFQSRADRARTVVISFLIDKENGVSKHYVWRTYDNNPQSDNPDDPDDVSQWCVSNPGLAHTEPIWEVARATTAAPRYFESIKIRGKKFLDGGLVASNPSLLGLEEFMELHDKPALFVSIGTGLKRAEARAQNGNGNLNGEDFARMGSRLSDDERRRQWLRKYSEIFRSLKDATIDPEGLKGTEGWRRECRRLELQHTYRLNVKEDLAKIPLDDWRPSNTGQDTLDEIRSQTDIYLRDERVRQTINNIAQQAVEIRRKRAETERWEEFALEVTYECPLGGCRPRTYDKRAELRSHLRHADAHNSAGLTDNELEARLNEGRRFGEDYPYPRPKADGS